MAEQESSHVPPSSGNDPSTPMQEDKNGSSTTTLTKINPLGPFNEGVPTEFKKALPSGLHRGILCEQPVTELLEPVLDEDHLEIVSVMGLEVEDHSSERETKRHKKGNNALVTKQLASRVNLPKLQFANRDKNRISKLSSIKSIPLPAKGSRNDLSDDEEADLQDFEVPFMDLGTDLYSMEGRLTNVIKDGAVYSKEGTLLCQDTRIAIQWILHCHICDKKGFQNREEYDLHLKGKMHDTLRTLHLEKLKAGLTYLRAGSKRAEFRLAMGLLRSPEDPSPKMKMFCEVCGCNVYEMRLHTQLPQHKIVEKFVFPSCCGEKFRNRVSFDDHRCSVQHQIEVFKERLALSHRLEQGRLKDGEDQQSLPEYLRLLKGGCIINNDDSTLNLTPYDPDRPNVVKMLKYYGIVQCMCCGDSFSREQLEELYEHVHSIDHYEASVMYATQRERSVLADIAKRKAEYPAAVKTHCRKAVRVAEALVEEGRERASNPNAGSERVLAPPAKKNKSEGAEKDNILATAETTEDQTEVGEKEEEMEEDMEEDDYGTDMSHLEDLIDNSEPFP